MLRSTSQRVIALGLSLVSVVAFSACDPDSADDTGVPGIDKFAADGPAPVQVVRVGQCTRFLPPSGAPGSRIGLGWANGTGASPNTYATILQRSASFGAVVTAANTPNSGTGREVSVCIDELARDRSDASGDFATAGHSQGGSGCINAARRVNMANGATRVVTTCQVQPDGTFTVLQVPGNNPAIDGTCGLAGRVNCEVTAQDLAGSAAAPAVIMCGTADNLAPCGNPGNGNVFFARANVPVVKLNVIGATHTGDGSPVGQGGLYSSFVAACVSAAGGDADASAALRPGGGLAQSDAVREVEFRNF